MPDRMPERMADERRQERRERLRRRQINPMRTVVAWFLAAILVGTLLLKLPWMTAARDSAGWSDAFFTSTSAITVTGLSHVDTATYWSTWGHVTIMILIQVGGLGITTLGTLVIWGLTRRLGVTSRLVSSTESGGVSLGDVGKIIKGILAISLLFEFFVFACLWLRLVTAYDMGPGFAAWEALFHSVSAWNNAGFALRSDSLIGLGGDIFIVGPFSVAILVGGLGYPVLLELAARWRSRPLPGTPRPARKLSVHTRLTLAGTLICVLVGWAVVTIFEFRNPLTLAAYPTGERLVATFFTGGVTPRTAGFNAIDYAQASGGTRFITDILMMIGSGSAGTGGGLKVTTMMILLLAVRAEIRGQRDVNTKDRRIPPETVRLAVSVFLLYLGVVLVATFALMAMAGLNLDYALFEATSAIGTVGLSANVTPTLGWPSLFLLDFLMLLGRVGPLTLFTALALRQDKLHYRLPEGRPMVG